MRVKIKITKDNINEQSELWEIIKEVFAANEAKNIGGDLYQEGKAMKLIDDSVREGLITVDAELDADLTSDDDQVTYTLKKTARGKLVDRAAAKLLGIDKP